MPEPDGPPVMDDIDLGELLRREAALHRPDPERILARVEQARRQAATGSGPVSRAEPRRPRVLVRVAGAAAAAVALALSVTGLRGLAPGRPDDAHGAAVTVAGAGDRLPAAGGDGAVPGGSTSASPAAPGSGGASDRPAATLGSAVATTGPRPGTGGSPSRSAPASTGPRSPDPAAGTPSLQLTAAGAPSTVALPGPGDAEWLVVGARRDGRQVRAKRGTGAITEVTADGAAPAVADGGFEVSWSGGSPEETHTGARTWWTVPAGKGSFRIVVAVPGPATVRVRLGTTAVAASARPTLRAQLAGTPHPGTASVPVDAAITEAVVRVTEGGPGATLTLTFSSGSDVGVLGLSSVSVG